jgi:glycosyltransferase involved in cell wall biosynthesis
MRVSIVVPLYNKKRWITRCLDSITRQSMGDYEVVVVDDGSDDGGGELVRTRQDARVRLVQQAHCGEGSARNRGLAEARCEWLALLDADDEWMPQFLETALDTALLREGLVAAFTNVLDGGTRQSLMSSGPSGVLDDYFAFVLANRGFGMTSSSTLVRREALLSCGAFRVGVPVGADTDAWARLAWSGPVAYAGAPLAVYHRSLPGSATTAARGARPLFPAMVRSHAEWRDAGWIPAHLAQSSSRLAQTLLLDHAIALANLGLRREAWRVLRDECRPSRGALGRYWGAHLRLLLPHAMLRGLREAVRAPQDLPPGQPVATHERGDHERIGRA